jgi:ABC-2 type transport system permease protein
MKRWINLKVVVALLRRDLRMYFSNPTGYVFITLFIFLSAAAAFWQERFFLNNLANLEQLNAVFPYLLMLFVPALTMAAWAEERRQGTDELLLTLPATDLEVVLGKYLAVLSVYAISLLLSLSHVLVLEWLGSPDLGLMLGNYLGYFLLGGALIAVGMLGSLLAPTATIAFVLGALLCGALVFVGDGASLFSRELGRLGDSLSVLPYFSDFARGVASMKGLLYFLSVAGLALYLNVLLIGRRHWPASASGQPMWRHQLVRALCVAVGLVGLNAALGRASLRLDTTAERLHSLSPETRRLIGEISPERPVFIQAYVSPQVPQQYVEARENLLSVLAEIDAIAGDRVEVLVQETEPYTDAAREARERFGIQPRQIPELGSARAGVQDVFMGVAFTCGAEEQVIPFFDRGLPVEYEVVRSLRVVAKTARRRIGVVNTSLNLFGGLDFQTMRSTPPWSVVEELKKQYEVVQIHPNSPIEEKVDALLAVLPSSLTQEEMDNLRHAIEGGTPTLLLVDPMLMVNLGLSPSERAGTEMNPFMRQQGPPPRPKGDIQGLLSGLGVSWNSGQVVWDSYNPHPDLAQLPPEVVFVGEGNQSPAAFNEENPASRGMQELVLIYPGSLQPAAGKETQFTPLLRTGRLSGSSSYSQLVVRSFLGAQLNRNLPHRPDENDYVLAAQVRGPAQAEKKGEATEPGEGEAPPAGKAGAKAEAKKGAVDLMVIADVDFISEQFFEIRRIGPPNLTFDNVSFFLNCIDTLMGDESFVALRDRRVRHRTLRRVEGRTQEFLERRVADEKEAEAAADQALSEAQSRLDAKVQEVRQRVDLDAQTKQIMARNLQEVENRRFETLKANIESEKQARIELSKETVESEIRNIQSTIRSIAVLLPPIPVFFMGVVIFIRRHRREKEGAAAARRLRSGR